MNKELIAESFSMGRFEETYSYLSDSIEWNIVGESTITGIESVIQKCEETSNYFNSVTTTFNVKNRIIGDHQVVINGLAVFEKKDEVSFIDACDIYTFNDNGLLQKIESYCITIKNEAMHDK
ncbi:hypothetical protein PWEIH_00430 [Listeria weihenstephanensis FSL R9-0317]|uniref:SnoaL-like domain-containing protein n=1 Tax=Listeria weihenstephanensis TaxID=1006155 RepID=A0A1S7FSN0_9LIST|nr:hypothetical protein [Listeria weihenstephanensis]AQY50468.1 hypothetical protein UE46_05120 [Listeria weihenstephanensis]EUJ41484.1 hypothetical protein PWEIH_00430 [Listeria weihenstephanensis FSL R9-0317]